MFSLEAWGWTLLFVVALPVVAVGGALLVRRVVGAEVLARHNDVAGFIYAVIGVVYAVLLGFTAIIVWEQYRSAQEVAEREANALADLYRDARVFPREVRDQVDLRLRTYAGLVIAKEWPAMAVRRSSPETRAAFDQLWQTYQAFVPRDDYQKTWYAESVTRMSALGDERRSRLLSVRAGVPGVMWAVLLGGGAVVIGFAFLFGTRNKWAHALMIAGLSLMIGLVLLSIVALDHPFLGITRVGPEAFEQVLGILRG